MVLWWLLSGILVLSFILLIVLFGELPQFQNSIIAKTRTQLCRIPLWATNIDNHLTNGRLRRLAIAYWNRSERHLRWAVPIGYVSLMTGCLYMFHQHCYPRITSHTSLHHTIILFVYCLPYVITPFAVFSDPGKITKSNHLSVLRRFPYDSLLFMPGVECRTCRHVKPARSKHCSTCGFCIAVCDHHCIWLNNCVGYNNARWFLLFVIQNVVVLSYGFWLTWGIVANVVAERQQSMKVLAQNQSWFFQRYGQAIVSSSENRTAGCLMIMCFTLGIVALAFCAEQFRYVYLGVTTNETLKWEVIKDCMDDGNIYFYDHPSDELRNASHARNEPSIVLQKLAEEQNKFNRPLSESERHRIDSQNLVFKPLTSFSQINNIYDRGFWDTFRHRFFPDRL